MEAEDHPDPEESFEQLPEVPDQDQLDRQYPGEVPAPAGEPDPDPD